MMTSLTELMQNGIITESELCNGTIELGVNKINNTNILAQIINLNGDCALTEVSDNSLFGYLNNSEKVLEGYVENNKFVIRNVFNHNNYIMLRKLGHYIIFFNLKESRIEATEQFVCKLTDRNKLIAFDTNQTILGNEYIHNNDIRITNKICDSAELDFIKAKLKYFEIELKLAKTISSKDMKHVYHSGDIVSSIKELNEFFDNINTDNEWDKFCSYSSNSMVSVFDYFDIDYIKYEAEHLNTRNYNKFQSLVDDNDIQIDDSLVSNLKNLTNERKVFNRNTEASSYKYVVVLDKGFKLRDEYDYADINSIIITDDLLKLLSQRQIHELIYSAEMERSYKGGKEASLVFITNKVLIELGNKYDTMQVYSSVNDFYNKLGIKESKVKQCTMINGFNDSVENKQEQIITYLLKDKWKNLTSKSRFMNDQECRIIVNSLNKVIESTDRVENLKDDDISKYIRDISDNKDTLLSNIVIKSGNDDKCSIKISKYDGGERVILKFSSKGKSMISGYRYNKLSIKLPLYIKKTHNSYVYDGYNKISAYDKIYNLTKDELIQAIKINNILGCTDNIPFIKLVYISGSGHTVKSYYISLCEDTIGEIIRL